MAEQEYHPFPAAHRVRMQFHISHLKADIRELQLQFPDNEHPVHPADLAFQSAMEKALSALTEAMLVGYPTEGEKR